MMSHQQVARRVESGRSYLYIRTSDIDHDDTSLARIAVYQVMQLLYGDMWWRRFRCGQVIVPSGGLRGL